MNQRFVALVAPLEVKCQELLAMSPVAASDVAIGTPVGGVYLFSEGDVHLYAGRTKRSIRDRIRNQFGKNPDAASLSVAHHPWGDGHASHLQEEGITERATCGSEV